MLTTSSSTKCKSSRFKRGEIRFRSLELARSKRGEHLSLIKIRPFSEIPTGQFKAHFITLSFRRAIKTNSPASVSFARNILHDNPAEDKKLAHYVFIDSPQYECFKVTTTTLTCAKLEKVNAINYSRDLWCFSSQIFHFNISY